MTANIRTLYGKLPNTVQLVDLTNKQKENKEEDIVQDGICKKKSKTKTNELYKLGMN